VFDADLKKKEVIVRLGDVIRSRSYLSYVLLNK